MSNEQTLFITFEQGNYNCKVVITDHGNGFADINWKFNSKPEDFQKILLFRAAARFLDMLKECGKWETNKK